LLTGTVVALVPLVALAHVKWFSQYDYAQHVPAGYVTHNRVLWTFLLIATVGLWLIYTLEGTMVGAALASRLGELQERLDRLRRRVLICACIFYFTAVATIGNVILTPELVTKSGAVRWLQAAAAIGLFFKRGEPLAGVALLTLFGVGLWEYGAFHMLDYLLFLGPAVYFLLPHWPTQKRIRVLRISVAASLLWVAVEKWVYPEWVMQVVHDHPVITFGFPQQQFVVLAGVVEFALAFGLLWRGLYSVFCALALAGFLSAAILEFGFVDLVGHIVVLGVLAVLALDRIDPPRRVARSPAWTVAALFLGSCVAVIATYHGLAWAFHA